MAVPPPQFTDEEIDDLVAFFEWIGQIDTNGFPATPTLASAAAPSAASTSPVARDDGRPHVFDQICVACHAIDGRGGNDTLYGGPDNDHITGGAGRDNVFGDSSTCCYDNGNDTIDVRDGGRDAVNCGGGADVVKADKKKIDVVAQDGLQRCERVKRK